ncbi:MAG: GFA family protein [Pseudomonadota bacterium]
MPDQKTYSGGCHCGAVQYELTTELTGAMECNCSICAKRGALWAFAKPEQMRLLKGENTLADYQFGKKRIHHLFCENCGVSSFSRGTGPDGSLTYAINVRCLEGVDPSALKITPFDGKSM